MDTKTHKVYEIVRTKDLKSFYVIAENEFKEIKQHFLNLYKVNPEPKNNIKFFDTGYSYILKYGNDVYQVVYKYRNKNEEDDDIFKEEELQDEINKSTKSIKNF